MKLFQRLRNRKALTLVEVLIATIVFSLIVVAAFSIYQPMTRVANMVKGDSEMQKVVSSAEGYVQRQLRNAGEILMLWDETDVLGKSFDVADPTAPGYTPDEKTVAEMMEAFANGKDKAGDVPQALIIRKDPDSEGYYIYNIRLNSVSDYATALTNLNDYRVFSRSYYSDIALKFAIEITPSEIGKQDRGGTYLSMQVDAQRTSETTKSFASRNISDTLLTWIGKARGVDDDVSDALKRAKSNPQLASGYAAGKEESSGVLGIGGNGDVVGAEFVILYHNNIYLNRYCPPHNPKYNFDGNNTPTDDTKCIECTKNCGEVLPVVCEKVAETKKDAGDPNWTAYLCKYHFVPPACAHTNRTHAICSTCDDCGKTGLGKTCVAPFGAGSCNDCYIPPVATTTTTTTTTPPPTATTPTPTTTSTPATTTSTPGGCGNFSLSYKAHETWGQVTVTLKNNGASMSGGWLAKFQLPAGVKITGNDSSGGLTTSQTGNILTITPVSQYNSHWTVGTAEFKLGLDASGVMTLVNALTLNCVCTSPLPSCDHSPKAANCTQCNNCSTTLAKTCGDTCGIHKSNNLNATVKITCVSAKENWGVGAWEVYVTVTNTGAATSGQWELSIPLERDINGLHNGVYWQGGMGGSATVTGNIVKITSSSAVAADGTFKLSFHATTSENPVPSVGTSHSTRKPANCTECNLCHVTGLPKNCGDTCGIHRPACVTHTPSTSLTCTAGSTCITCGATISALPHNYNGAYEKTATQHRQSCTAGCGNYNPTWTNHTAGPTWVDAPNNKQTNTCTVCGGAMERDKPPVGGGFGGAASPGATVTMTACTHNHNSQTLDGVTGHRYQLQISVKNNTTGTTTASRILAGDWWISFNIPAGAKVTHTHTTSLSTPVYSNGGTTVTLTGLQYLGHANETSTNTRSYSTIYIVVPNGKLDYSTTSGSGCAYCA